MSPAVWPSEMRSEVLRSSGGNLIGGDVAAAGNIISGNNRGIELASVVTWYKGTSLARISRERSPCPI